MSFSTVLFTDRGRALQAKAMTGAALNFTKLQMGSGSLGGQSQITLRNLIDPKVTINISEITRDTNYATIKGNFSNADISTGFYWRELGVFAQDPDLGEILYCYGNAGALAEYIPPQSSEIIEKTVSLSVIVGNASQVTATINTSLVFAKIEDLKDLGNNLSVYQAAGGTANEITLANVEWIDGKSISFIVKSNNNGLPTTINGKPLYKPKTTVAPALIEGKAVTVWYNAAGDRFFIKASAEGNANAGHVLAPYTFSNDLDTGIAGTMKNNGPAEAETIELRTEGAEYPIAKGYHSGLRKIKAKISGLVAGVIKHGTTVGGITGTFTSDGDITAGDVLSGKLGYSKGNKITGNIPTLIGSSFNTNVYKSSNAYRSMPSDGKNYIVIPIPDKNYTSDISAIASEEPNLTPDYIRPNSAIAGVSGQYTNDADAIASNILLNKTAYVKGNKITGSIPSKSAQTYTPGTSNQIIGSGQYLSEAQSIKGDANLIPANILQGKSIFGVVGTLIPGFKYATGETDTSLSTVKKDIFQNDRTVSMITVDGLSFKAKLIILFGYAENKYSVICRNPYGGDIDGNAWEIIVDSSSSSGSWHFSTQIPTSQGIYVNNTGFSLPYALTAPHHSYLIKWLALDFNF